MTKIISLFSDEVEAEQAVNALTEADLNDVDVHVVEKWNAEMDTVPTVLPGNYSGTSSAPGMGVPVTSVLPDFRFEGEVKELFKRNLNKGGVLVVVQLSDDDELSEVKQLLEEEGGRYVTEMQTS